MKKYRFPRNQFQIVKFRFPSLVYSIFDVLQGTVSHIILCQFVATALVLVMIALNYLLFSPNFTEVIALAFFVVAEISQILPCCYYSNKFQSTTDDIVTSIYSCDWYNHTTEFKKTLIIFMQMTQRGKVIVAGKVIPVTMATFTSVCTFQEPYRINKKKISFFSQIIKLSYSLLTVAQRIRH